jgi:putative lumazine-binding protein
MPARRTANAAGAAARDRSAVIQVVADYYASWFAGDPELMRASLHPDLAKRSVEQGTRGDPVLDTVGTEGMVEATARGAGKKYPPGHDLVIFDLDEELATVKVTSAPYVEYLHLARFGERWLIVNALWRGRPHSAPHR